ncbi:hypothetical protein SLS54_007748 [Diplodia seriata]
MSAPVGAVPSSCCKRDGTGCVCAKEATCSCGKQKALHCTCEKASMENKLSGATCSCGMSRTLPSDLSIQPHIDHVPPPIPRLDTDRQRSAGACTCNRASEENTVSGDKCACGKRSSTSCTCAGTETGQSELETDFTTKK